MKIIAISIRKIGSLFHYISQFLIRLSQKMIPGAVPVHKEALDKWYQQKGDQTLRVDYPLSPEAEVWDVGGYVGDWAAEISARYGCKIHVFEPVEDFIRALEDRFSANPHIQIHPYGLSAMDKEVEFSAMAESSTILKTKQAYEWQNKETIIANLRSFSRTAAELQTREIDLIKINIEGGEYELLEEILANGWVYKISNLQIQFHDFFPDARERMEAIQEKLSFTHELTYQYPFVWENWKLIKA